MADLTTLDSIIVNGVLSLIAGANTYLQFSSMTTAERNIMVAGFGADEEAAMWVNDTTNQLEGWKGSSVSILS